MIEEESTLKRISLEHLMAMQTKIHNSESSSIIKSSLYKINQTLMEYPEFSSRVNLLVLKVPSLLYAYKDFLIFLLRFNRSENDIEKIYELLIDENVTVYMSMKLCNFLENVNLNKNVSDSSESSDLESEKNDLKTETQNQQNIVSETNLDTINNDQSEENNNKKKNKELRYIDYITDEEILTLLNIFRDVFLCKNAIKLLNILNKVGIFDLLSVIVTEEVTSIYENIFKYKIYSEINNIDIQKIYISNHKKYLPVHQLNRELFDSEIIVKERQTIIEQKLFSKYTFTSENIYVDIASNFFKLNIYYFIYECGISSLTNTINFYISYINLKKEKNFEKIDKLMKILYSDENIVNIQRSLNKDSPPELIKLYGYLLKYSTYPFVENNMVLFDRLLMNQNSNKNMMKILTDTKYIDIFKEACITVYFYLRCISFYNKNTTEKIDEEKAFNLIIDEKIVNRMIELLTYNFIEKKYVVKMLRFLYHKPYFNKCFMYKPSHLIVFREFVYKIDRKFALFYFKDVLVFFDKNSSNMVRNIFRCTEKKNSKNILEDASSDDFLPGVDENINIKNKDTVDDLEDLTQMNNEGGLVHEIKSRKTRNMILDSSESNENTENEKKLQDMKLNRFNEKDTSIDVSKTEEKDKENKYFEDIDSDIFSLNENESDFKW